MSKVLGYANNWNISLLYLFLCMMATIASPSLQDVVKLLTLTPGYLWVVR